MVNIVLSVYYMWDFPGCACSKESTFQLDARDMDLILGSGRSPGLGYDNPLQCSWAHKELDTTEWVSTHMYYIT